MVFKVGDKNPSEKRMKAISKYNRQRVNAFFKKYPYANQDQCAEFLGLTIRTVCAHVCVLRTEHHRRFRADMRGEID